jgi:hypothetical protein
MSLDRDVATPEILEPALGHDRFHMQAVDPIKDSPAM